MIWSGVVSQEPGIFRQRPRFPLSTPTVLSICFDAICQGDKVLSSDIFGLKGPGFCMFCIFKQKSKFRKIFVSSFVFVRKISIPLLPSGTRKKKCGVDFGFRVPFGCVCFFSNALGSAPIRYEARHLEDIYYSPKTND